MSFFFFFFLLFFKLIQIRSYRITVQDTRYNYKSICRIVFAKRDLTHACFSRSRILCYFQTIKDIAFLHIIPHHFYMVEFIFVSKQNIKRSLPLGVQHLYMFCRGTQNWLVESLVVIDLFVNFYFTRYEDIHIYPVNSRQR